jgi:iron complex transport system substrate-binding protein
VHIGPTVLALVLSLALPAPSLPAPPVAIASEASLAPPSSPAARGAARPDRAAAEPQRIVSLVPAVTEMLFAIGAGPRVVGVSSFDRHPPEVARRPRVGALIDPDVERILGLEPDLVVVYATQDTLRAQLARAGIDLFAYRHGGLADVAATIRALGARVGAAAAADRVAGDIERAIDRVRARVAGRPRPPTLLVFGREPGSLRNVYASGGRGFLHDMLEAAGGQNVLADMPRESVRATTELVLARQPEVILEIRAAGTGPDPGEDARRAWRALPAVPAVRNGRVIALTGDDLVVPGPRVAAGIQRLAEALHGRR